jgi:hypothetical protein
MYLLLVVVYFTLILSCSTSTKLDKKIDISKDLVAFYPFTEGAFDESGNENDGVVYNTILTEDKLGNIQNAYQFNGDGYISIEHDSILNPDGLDFSISVWFKFNGIFDSSLITYCIISKGYYYRESHQEWKIELRGGEYNGAYLRYRTYTEVPQDFMFEEDLSSVITNENWHHLVVVVNEGSSPEGKIYLDGELRGVREEFSLIIDPQENLQIGWYRGSGTFFKGVLDQIRIYKRAISQDEIEYLFENYL